jgi:hypothetical protein
MIPSVSLSPITDELVLSVGKSLRRKPSRARRVLIIGGGVTGLTVRLLTSTIFAADVHVPFRQRGPC